MSRCGYERPSRGMPVRRQVDPCVQKIAFMVSFHTLPHTTPLPSRQGLCRQAGFGQALDAVVEVF